jgi:hypothetical protein
LTAPQAPQKYGAYRSRKKTACFFHGMFHSICRLFSTGIFQHAIYLHLGKLNSIYFVIQHSFSTFAA